MGFIKIDRQILNWEWYKNINVKTLWMHILLKANCFDKKWQGVDVPSGSFITSISHLSEETGLTVKQVRNCLEKLESTNEITIKRAKQFTQIYVNKWEQFQCIETDEGNLWANQGQSEGKVGATTKESIRKYKKVKNNIFNFFRGDTMPNYDDTNNPNISEERLEEILNGQR